MYKRQDEQGIEYVERTGTTTDEVQLAAEALIADGVDAVFTPTDNTIMTAELSIYEKDVYKRQGIQRGGRYPQTDCITSISCTV